LGLLKDVAGRYDFVFDLHGTPASAVFARVASRGRVVGYAGKRCSALYSEIVEDREPERHTVEVNLDLLAAAGLPRPAEVTIEAPADDARTARVRATLDGPGAILHPGGRFAHKLWPAERFRVVAEELKEKGFAVRVLLGPGETLPLPLREFEPVAGIPPRDLGPVLRAFDLFVGNDSGPMHFAAAAGCRVVGIFGPSSTARWRPWSHRSIALSAPCRCGAGWQAACRNPEAWCLAAVTVEEVLAAVDRLLETPSSRKNVVC
jgi:ADP-heptose:LPS heptosyltransferase